MQKHEEHIKKYHSNDQGETTNSSEKGLVQKPCQSYILHNEENRKDIEENSDDEDAENEENFRQLIRELYKNRLKSPEAMRKWKEVEKELYPLGMNGGPKHNGGQNGSDPNDGNIIEIGAKAPMPLEPIYKSQINDDLITSCARVSNQK